jgi:hypothetical protein
MLAAGLREMTSDTEMLATADVFDEAAVVLERGCGGQALALRVLALAKALNDAAAADMG